MNASELKPRMAERAADIAKYLLPGGKQRAGEWKIGNTSGEPGDSLSVCIRGHKAGVWSDFASGEGGDLLDLWMACRGLGIVDAMKEVKQYLGIRDDFPKPPEKTYRRPVSPGVPAAKGRALEWLRGRGLTDETIRAFKVAEQVQHGKIYAVFPFIDQHGELINIKYRNIDEKKDMRQEAGAAPCLFGWHLIDAKARVVTITEGEIDAMTLHQMRIPTLSVNQGAGNHQWLETDWDKLERFDEILVCFDNDEAGDKGAKEVIQRLGVERCRRVRLGAKDANQWLQDGAEAVDFQQAMDDARPLDPEELRNADDFTPEVESLFYPDPDAPRDPVLQFDRTFDFFEFRLCEYTCWTGINGHGKSLMLDQVLLGLMAQGERVVVFSGEMMPGRHLLRMHKQATGLGKPTREYIRAVGAWLRERCWLFDLVGIARLDRLLEVFGYAARRYGVRHFVIDSLMMIDVPADGPGAITKQNEAVQKITAFAKAHGAHIHIVAHPRKLKDEAEAPSKMEVAGAGGIVNRADNVFSVWRAQKDEAPPNPNDGEAVAAWEAQQADFDAKLILKKQRNGLTQDYTLLLWFDKASMQYRSQSRRYPLSYVPFSNQENQ
ncbi:toprim domain-containing protein [Variovorax sp. RA8]|uniref:toprim domain-containing protein n=1 Tax=Variovorax sp. (strain JCM 16519 / RA8) TaxID=662548 RepID=UPI001317D17A|nr:toprim domain-containing protein [Variovorax sp. RA8]VTU34223.1 DNA primase domain-containing protein [Variovorax sp. RA8]